MTAELRFLEQRLTQHIDECDRRFDQGAEQFNELIRCTKENTDAVTKLIKETEGVVKLYSDMRGVIRIGSASQQLGLWIIKWPIVGAAIFAIYRYFVPEGPSS